jgi:hypothetical protein
VRGHTYTMRDGSEVTCFCMTGRDHGQADFGVAPTPDPQE